MSMPVIRTVAEAQARSERLRLGGHRIALVPTMGALHPGHLALVREARRHGDIVLMSVYVNPTQFGANEDLTRYPRRLEQDLELLADIGGVDGVFAPTDDEMYPSGTTRNGEGIWVDASGLDRHLCGAFRPGHFRAVATIVAKLLHACKPRTAVFGRKDAQQFVIIQRMVRDLLMDVEVVGIPTVRADDGLALSSRNEYLTSEERSQAPVLFEAVNAASEAVLKGEQRVREIVRAMRTILARAPLAEVQYCEVVDAETLQPVRTLKSGKEVLAATAVYFGKTRLIDSEFIRVP